MFELKTACEINKIVATTFQRPQRRVHKNYYLNLKLNVKEVFIFEFASKFPENI